MPPHVFKEQLKRVFNIQLSPPELGALMHFFDKDGDKVIDCSEFLITFFKLGFAEKEKRNKAELKAKAEKAALKEAKRKRIEAEEDRKAREFERNFTETDRQSAMAKIEQAAYLYDRNSPGALNLNGFQGSDLKPGEFKEQLKRVFGIKLNAGELGAVMDHFDKDKGGTVGTAEFLIQFFKTGFEKRAEHTKMLRELEQKVVFVSGAERTREGVESH